MEKPWCVYAHISKITGMVYIGITSQKLGQRFRGGEGYKKSCYFYAAIQKYGLDSFKHMVIAKGLSEKSAKEVERFVITSLKEQNIPLYNLTISGDGMSGSQRSEDSIRRLSEALKGKPKSVEHRKHLSESRIGRFCGADNPNYGHHHSKDAKKRIGDAQRGTKNINYGRAGQDTTASKRVRQYSLDGQLIREYPSLSEAGRVNGIGVSGISKCCLSVFTQSHGYKWSFANKYESEESI